MSTPVWLEQLREKGYKLTSQRQNILEVLSRLGRRASARDVHSALTKIMPAASLDTVYRNLRLLAEIGIVQQISLPSGAVFELSEQQHHHHLICVGCETVVCIPYCPDAGVYTGQAKAAGFEVLGHLFEVYGRCDNCRK